MGGRKSEEQEAVCLSRGIGGSRDPGRRSMGCRNPRGWKGGEVDCGRGQDAGEEEVQQIEGGGRRIMAWVRQVRRQGAGRLGHGEG